MNSIFSGVCTALVTPFKEDAVDYPALADIIEHQIESGIDALCILGTTGEAPTLTYDEKVSIIKFAQEVIDERVPVIFGIGGNNPTEITKLGRAVKKNYPTAAVMVTAPYYNKCTQNAAVMYFHVIANALKLPMVVYNVPGRAGMNLEPETLEQIAKNKYIVGIKEASGNISQIIDVVRYTANEGITVYCGDDAIALPAYSVGCGGVISVASNVRPKETRNVWLDRDTENFLEEIKYYKSLFCEINPGPVKYAMHIAGFCSPKVRPPLTELGEKSILQYEFRDLFKRTCD